MPRNFHVLCLNKNVFEFNCNSILNMVVKVNIFDQIVISYIINEIMFGFLVGIAAVSANVQFRSRNSKVTYLMSFKTLSTSLSIIFCVFSTEFA